MVTRRASVATIDDRLLQAERVRLVRLCYRLTGNLDVAEDLTQETLFEAMRNAHKVYDAAGYGRWLSAIARNVCRRWNERQGRQVAQQRSLRTPHATGDAGGDDLDVPDVDYDLDIELNRRELVVLLDRALILLPDESRAVLIERYFRESPYAAIAARLGVNAATAAKRLERGRLRLRQVLSTYLLHEAVHYGLAERLLDDWEETPIWCPDCGKRRLFGSIEGMMGATFTLSRSFRPSAPIPATPAPCGPSSERRKRRQGR